MSMVPPENAICIAISQSSRRFAMIDIINAQDQCDLLEIRLDRFSQTPDVKQLLESCTKPAIVSCRRRLDGGEWSGAETARHALLRQAVLDGAAYVEIELDCVDEIRRYGETKRIISYTNLDRVPTNLADIYARACSADADVVKLALAPTSIEEMQIALEVLERPPLPTVLVGWQQSHLFFDILQRQRGTPWTYVALEKGMEAHPGLPTLTEAVEWMDLTNITATTPLLGLVANGEETEVVTGVLNRLLREAGNPMRCLPIELPCGLSDAAAMLQWLPLDALFFLNPVDPLAGDWAAPADDWGREESVADFYHKTPQGWRSYSTLFPALLETHETRIRKRFPVERPLVGRTFLIVGTEPLGKAIGRRIQDGGGELVWTDIHAEAAQAAAKEIGGEAVPANKTGKVFRHGLIVCKQSRDQSEGILEISTSREREETYAIDLSKYPLSTRLIRNVQSHGGLVIPGREIFLRQLRTVVQLLTGTTLDDDVIGRAFAGIDFE